jgi:hypothetical protein
MMKKSTSLFYLLGLICGKGYILENSLSINFPHHKKIVEGIAHCPKCDFLATKTIGSLDNTLKCKNSKCDNSKGGINSNIKKKYYQRELFTKSIKDNVIPFLNENLEFDYSILASNAVTILNIKKLDKEIIKYIKEFFDNKTSFDRFEINKEINLEDKKLKVEFVNGLLDSCGYPSAGGWLNRDGQNGHGRMRSYFQIVRNWKLPVQIDNFLRDNFNIPTAKFDWGHPNIRDPSLQDYINQNESSYARECQVGFFPEYFKEFKHRVSPKIELFKELLEHNLKVKFLNDDDWLKTKKKITSGKIKPSHPMENDYRIPKEIRGHFDAEWQINLALGCKYLKEIQDKANDPEIFRISGDLDKQNLQKIKSYYHDISQRKYSLINLDKKKKTYTSKKIEKKISEQQTYKPLCKWLEKYIKDNTGEESQVFDTSAQTLNNYLRTNLDNFSIIEDKIKDLEDFDIRPDVVGISNHSSKLFFIESKVVALGIKEVGQLWAYSVIANPETSFLISTSAISSSLLKIISNNPEFLDFTNEKRIKMGFLKKSGDVEIYND